MRLLADACMGGRIVAALWQAGHDAARGRRTKRLISYGVLAPVELFFHA